MLKKDDKTQQAVYYQVCKSWILVLVGRRLKYSILGWNRNVSDSGRRDTSLDESTGEG